MRLDVQSRKRYHRIPHVITLIVPLASPARKRDKLQDQQSGRLDATCKQSDAADLSGILLCSSKLQHPSHWSAARLHHLYLVYGSECPRRRIVDYGVKL